jgi:lipoprotein NlpI
VNPPPTPPVNSGAVTNPGVIQQLNAELAAADAIIKKDPSNLIGYLQRGNVYANEKHWDLATADYQHALQIDGTCVVAAFNISEIEFLQGHYEAARPGFVAIVNNSDFGDLAKYRVFLCDLFGGHEQVAGKELAVFNQVGSEASYYFANVAWSAYHKNQNDAQSWLDSAKNIFAPAKVTQYAQPLVNLGYINLAS